MAKIPTSSGGLGALGEPPPAGTYLSVCVGVIDSYGVERKKFQSEETELQDVTRFVFGVKTKTGALHLIATREFKISGSPKSNLTKFIKAWTGENPKAGADTTDLKGRGAQISVTAEEARNGKTYNNISGIAPVMDGLEDKVPAVNSFANIGSTTAAADEAEMAFIGEKKIGGDPF